MNNLKRVLSLGLVGAMLSGMMIMGASAADFSDVDEIDNIEAVQTMVSLNIINGKDDGSFSPDETVTRSQMAKMIAVAMNGGKEPNFGTKSTPTFTDIKGHWAETFIEYCADLNIISGRGDGTFDPDGNVTGVEAAKMVLSALNYDATAYQLVGPDWSTNVNSEATQTCSPSLYDEVENVNVNQPIDRDTAAQIIWNGLQNETLTKTPDKAVSTGEVTYNYRPSGRTLLEVRYDAQIGFGTLVGNDKTESISEGHIKLENFKLDVQNPTNVSSLTFPYDTDLTNIGEEVKVIFKDGKLGRAGQPDKNDTIYGVFNSHKTDVVTGVMNDVKEVKSATKYVLKIDGTEYDVDQTNGVEVIENYKTSNGTTYTGSQLVGSSSASSALSQALIGANGNPIKAVMNSDGEISKVYVVKSQLRVVTAVSSDKVTIANVGTLKKADNDIYEDVAKDDVVVVTTLYHATPTNDDAYNIVEKAETVEGELTKYKNRENVTVDGETYKVYHSSLATKDTDELVSANISKALSTVADANVGKDVELFLVNGYVGAVKLVSKDANNYSVVLDVRTNGSINSVFDDLKLQVMAADGTKTVITVADDSTDQNKAVITSASAFSKGDIVTYDTNKDGTATVQIKGKRVVADDVLTYDKDRKSLVFASGNTYVTAADCILFVDNDETPGFTGINTDKVNYKAYTIRNLGDINTSKAYSYVVSDGKIVAAAMRTGTPAGAGSTRVYGMVTGYAGSVRIDNTSYRQYTINVNGEEYTVNQKSTAWSDAAAANNSGVDHQLSKGKIVTFEPTSDNFYENKVDFTVVVDGVTIDGSNRAKAVWVREYTEGEGIIETFTNVTWNTINGTTTYTGDDDTTLVYAVDDEVKMFFVDTDNDTAMASGSVNSMNVMTGYKSAILIVDNNGTGVVKAIIAEVSGEADVTA